VTDRALKLADANGQSAARPHARDPARRGVRCSARQRDRLAHERAEWQRRNQIELAMLPARHPRLVECAAPMTRCDDPEFHCRLGVELFIADVKAVTDKMT
jgi:hypothetical protein